MLTGCVSEGLDGQLSPHVGDAARCGAFLFPRTLGTNVFQTLFGHLHLLSSSSPHACPLRRRAGGSHTPKPEGVGCGPPGSAPGTHRPGGRRLSLHFVPHRLPGPPSPTRRVRTGPRPGPCWTLLNPLTSSPGPPLDAGVPMVAPCGKPPPHGLQLPGRRLPSAPAQRGLSLRGARADGAPAVTSLPQVDVF